MKAQGAVGCQEGLLEEDDLELDLERGREWDSRSMGQHRELGWCPLELRALRLSGHILFVPYFTSTSVIPASLVPA